MTSPSHMRKLKVIEFDLDGEQFECQLTNARIVNNTPDGEKFFFFCPDGELREDGNDDYALELTYAADWRPGGISDFFVTHDKETLTFILDHHPDIVGEHIRETGQVKIKAPSIGGAVRTNEIVEQTMPIIGKPVYTRP